MNNNSDLPRIPYLFFKWYCDPERYEEIHGDLEEFFNERAGKNLHMARRLYWWDVLRCCQPYAWKKSRRHLTYNSMMLSNYLKVSIRGLLKHPVSSFINVFGLSVAIGICLVAYSFLQFDHNIDRHHENRREVFLVTYMADRDGTSQQYGPIPAPLGGMLSEDFAQIKKVCRVKDRSIVVKYKDVTFQETIRYVDPEFLEMLTFPLKWGTATALTEPRSIILSEEMSIKYFGLENPVGRDLTLIFGEGRSEEFTIAGVAQAFPKAHAIDFDFLINFENLTTNKTEFDARDWSTFVNATLIQVENPVDIVNLEKKMEKYVALNNESQNDWIINKFVLESLAELHKRSGHIRDDISNDGVGVARIAIPVIAAFMLVLSCFNYMNISIVSASRRLREIGVRKVIGATRAKMVVQFLTENIVITSFALILGLVLTLAIFLPWFTDISGKYLELKLIDKNFWVFLLSFLLLTATVSGLYPACYISRFDAIAIFRSSVQFGKRNPLTQFFLGFQLILACILITGAVVYNQNSNYQNTRSWGYDQGSVLYASVPDQTGFDRLRDRMIQVPDVISVSGSAHHLGKSMTVTMIHLPDRQFEVQQLAVDAGYLETMGLRLKAGRVFTTDAENDKQKVIVNELLVKNLSWDQPIGKQFEINDIRYEVIGVVEDFHSYNFYNDIRPSIFTLSQPQDYRFMSVRTREGSELETWRTLEEQWAKLFPEIPLQGGRQKDVWGRFFDQVDTQERFTRTIALVAVLISGMGLYGLVSLNVAGRVRELSIRRVLGADVKNIAVDITSQYVWLALVAIVAGAPLSYILINGLIVSMYAYSVSGYLGVLIAVIILFGILLCVVSTQVLKVLRSNPVSGLNVD